MTSGRQIAEENFRIFTSWGASKTDLDFRSMASRVVLSRAQKQVILVGDEAAAKVAVEILSRSDAPYGRL